MWPLTKYADGISDWLVARFTRPYGGIYPRKEKAMDIKEAMKIVAYNVIVNGNEEIELALQTVEKTLGLEPVISHGNGESFHYKDLEIE